MLHNVRRLFFSGIFDGLPYNPIPVFCEHYSVVNIFARPKPETSTFGELLGDRLQRIGHLLLPRLGFWQRWSEAANRYSAAIRLAAATVISYLVCRLVLLFPGTISYRPGEFGPEVAAILVGIAATLALLLSSAIA